MIKRPSPLRGQGTAETSPNQSKETNPGTHCTGDVMVE